MTSTRDGFRSYEIYQRERVGESTPLLKARQLRSKEFAADPYPLLTILRENYPCYRDWHGNAFWLTRYDDVTSVFVDDANFETRSKLWHYRRPDFGRDLRHELPVLVAEASGIDRHVGPLAADVVAELAARSKTGDSVDLAVDVGARLPVRLLARVVGLPDADVPWFASRYWKMQRGIGWNPVARQVGLDAMDDLCTYFEPRLAARRSDPGDDLLSAFAALELPGGPVTSADLVTTLLEGDHETLHGSLASVLMQIVADPEKQEHVRLDPRFVTLAYLEVLRHSPPTLATHRYARHEVERFGRLLPEGCLMICSAAAAGRDPRAFPNNPDTFVIDRRDMCHREPRGHYRADGLPTGIAFGLGKPSRFPALPEDRPRSRYAITRDTASTIVSALLDAFPRMELADEADAAPPTQCSPRPGATYTCWSLPTTLRR